ncbi:MAG: cytosine deaminase [Bacillota bacterium]|nr:cytosine deaminase [Bacillota bacterium]HHU61481.1 cytosine deaminase [Natronincola sp.]
MDLIIRNAKLRDKKELYDLGIENGKFTQIETTIKDEGKQEIDAGGNLVIPPFIESHVHLDSALTVGNPRFNESGTLLDGIAIWGEYKEGITKERIKATAKETILWEMANGVLRIRTHADSTEPNLLTVQALLELKEEMRDYVDIQVVAFPQDGILAHPQSAELLEKAVKMGADVIGGIPQVEFTREDGIRSIEIVFELAQKYEKLIDIHTDETSDDQSRFAEVIAKHAVLSGMEGMVTASHTTAMHNYDNDYAAKLIGLLKRAEINIITNPASNALLQNRLDGYPRRRGHTRVDELLHAGVNVSIGNDNIMDPFGPLGKGSMLQSANLLIHTAHLSGSNLIPKVFDLITINGAKTLNLTDYGIELGNQADLVILDAKDEYEALRLLSEAIYVVRKGRVVVETKVAEREITLGSETVTVDFKR